MRVGRTVGAGMLAVVFVPLLAVIILDAIDRYGGLNVAAFFFVLAVIVLYFGVATWLITR